MRSILKMSALAAAVAMAGTGTTQAADDFTEALTGGKPWLDARYRLETVEQDNALKDATASTLRLRLGYKTAEYKGFTGLVEFSTTEEVGDDDYNSGPSGNGNTAYSVVADPDVTRFNQYWVGYAGIADTTLTLGRQRIKLDNDRFIGNVGFRQQEQTFDAFRVVNKSLPDTTINYAYVDRVNRIFADLDDKDAAHHLVNVKYAGWPVGSITAYGYFLDYGTTVPQSSTRTLGLRFAGSHAVNEGTKLLYTLEAANQTDYEDFAGNYDADYTLLELGAAFSGVTVKVGHETLGSDSTAGKGFETRLATLHAFNGWTDQFLATPADGLQDLYVSVGGQVAGWNLLGVWHDFEADQGSNDYGSEWGVKARRAFGKNYAIEIKYASYQAEDGGKVDTDKLWVAGEVRF